MAMLARRAVVRAMAYKNSKIPFQFTCSSSPSSSSSSDVLLRNCWLPPLGLINYNRPPDDGHACSGWAKQQIREFGEIAGLQVAETRRLVQQVNMELLKKQLHASGHKEFVMYEDLINLCRQTGVATSEEAAERFVQALDEAGVVLIFRGKVFLHPEEIAEKVADVLPPVLLSEDDAHKKEFELLQKELEDIDAKAFRQVRNCLWMGLLSLTSGTILFFRLTFWEFSWDVMEPIAFFVTTGGLIGSYAYFLVTHRDPSYLGLMHSLLANRRKKLMKRRQFNFDRYRQLEGLYHSKPCSGLEKSETVANVQQV
ncbi:hypothetical protein O6H91_09G098600 [Diphasiastrum complanatum]|uniref:Uncharacterized protein n=1 Tax=Diphasiastrum complanatum TaxID=34168 RepID=A0ACC2CSE8_DIPCM|nr:hypothetical protein O6H91_09G098600 [Diphasiastrum complanatum]